MRPLPTYEKLPAAEVYAAFIQAVAERAADDRAWSHQSPEAITPRAHKSLLKIGFPEECLAGLWAIGRNLGQKKTRRPSVPERRLRAKRVIDAVDCLLDDAGMEAFRTLGSPEYSPEEWFIARRVLKSVRASADRSLARWSQAAPSGRRREIESLRKVIAVGWLMYACEIAFDKRPKGKAVQTFQVLLEEAARKKVPVTTIISWIDQASLYVIPDGGEGLQSIRRTFYDCS